MSKTVWYVGRWYIKFCKLLNYSYTVKFLVIHILYNCITKKYYVISKIFAYY